MTDGKREFLGKTAWVVLLDQFCPGFHRIH